MVRQDRLLLDQVDRWIYDEVRPYLGQRILEAGCGLGNFARYLMDRELYVGIDVFPGSVAHVEETYRLQPNVRAFVGDVTSDEFLAFSRFRIDTVVSINVLEHIEDHVGAFQNMCEVLQPGGRLALVVPAHRRLYGSMDRAIGHRRRYDKPAMGQLIENAGLRCEVLKYLNAAGALGWCLNGQFRHRETPPSAQLRFFNRFVPALKALERVVPPPFGVSLVAVAFKPTGYRKERP